MADYDTATLIGVQNRQQIDPLFFLQFFPDEITFSTEKIMFDEISEDRYILAPFVAPHVEGRVMERGGFDTRSFKPAYVKPKHDIDINQQFKRRAGEQPVVGSLSPQQRYDATIAENFRIEREMIERRINWMCAQALVNGAVVVEGEDYPRVTIDFNRDANLTEVLTSTARWGESAADPLGDLNVKMRLSRKLSGGRITNVIMGEEAYDRFYRNADVKALLDTNYRIGGTAADASILGMGDNDKEAELKAILSGVVRHSHDFRLAGDDLAAAFRDRIAVVQLAGRLGQGVEGFQFFVGQFDDLLRIEADALFHAVDDAGGRERDEQELEILCHLGWFLVLLWAGGQ